MKNLLLLLFVRLARLFIPLNPPHNRILIVATTALGDTLWATPAIENIRKAHPNAYIAVLTSPIGLEVLAHNPHIDQLHLLRYPFSLWKTLYRSRFDTVLLFHASQRIALPLVSLLGARRIIGTAGINKGLDALLTHPLPNHAQHEITRRLKIAEAIGAAPIRQTLSIHLHPRERLPPRQGRWIALHPGSKDAFKRWPAKNFIELGKMLPGNILITGTEHDLMQEIASQIPNAHIDDPNRPLRNFAALLSQMDLLISNDTGPVHLACALNIPVVAIYASTDPALCGPHQAPNAIVISRRPSCDPCLKRKCRAPFCFLQIGPQEVLAAAKKILHK